MESIVPIAQDIYWVGVNDHETYLFESIWPIPRGISYNSYMLVDEKVVLFDTVKGLTLKTLLDKIETVLGDKPIDYLVIHHLEPDHSGSIKALMRQYPNLTLIGNKKTAEFLQYLFGIGEERVMVVGDGEELNTGKRTLKFVMTPMVHWPETMMTYDADDKILFSGDAFGSFGALDGGIFDDEIDVDYYEDEILRYFSNIVGKYAPMVQKAFAKLEGVDVNIICATHGPIWRKNPEKILSLYQKYSKQESEPGVVLVYGSMYGNTQKMMEAVSTGVHEAGCKTLKVYNAALNHVSYILRDAWRYKGLILGGPTYDMKLFPPMETFINTLAGKKIAGKTVGIFGTYGWSGGGVKSIMEFAAETKQNLIEPVVESRFAPTDEDLQACRKLGRTVAENSM